MIKLARLFSKGKSAKVLPKVPEGERYYVIGDIHGRCDLFDELIVAIEDDDRRGCDTNCLTGSGNSLSFNVALRTAEACRVYESHGETIQVNHLCDKVPSRAGLRRHDRPVRTH